MNLPAQCPWLSRPLAGEDGGNRAQQDAKIETERPAINVFKVEQHPFAETQIAAPGNLP